MTSDVITPTAFNEPWTIYLNTDGNPVQRTLGEMTASEVQLAINWHCDEAARLEKELEPFSAIVIAVSEGRHEDAVRLTAGMTKGDFLAMANRSGAAGEAQKKAARLIERVLAMMPRYRGSNLSLREALRRWWPRG